MLYLTFNGKEHRSSPTMPPHIPKSGSKSRQVRSAWYEKILYQIAIFIFDVVFYIFFREIKIRGSFNFPTNPKTPVILVVAPHANQFIDGGLMMATVTKYFKRQACFVVAASSLGRSIVGFFESLTGGIPVTRVQDNLKLQDGTITVDGSTTVTGKGTSFSAYSAKDMLRIGTTNYTIVEVISDTEITLDKPVTAVDASFKYAQKVDMTTTYQHVFDHLHAGGVLGIFPEGGSHDRPNLLPIKAGVAIMGLGAVAADPSAEIQVIPVGLNYFHRNRFRSRAVIEFGAPITLNGEDGEKYKQQPRQSVSDLLDKIKDGLYSVTVNAPDYDTLMTMQAARRLYKDKIPLSAVVDMNRKLMIGYTKYKDEPKIAHLKEAVADYNKKLFELGIRDHQVEQLTKFRNLGTLFLRLIQLVVLLTLALPGTILFSPIFIIASKYSKKKQAEGLAKSVVKIKGKDLIATWKLLISMALAPILYATYSAIGTWYLGTPTLFTFVCIWAVLVATTYCAFRTGEVGMDIIKSIKPLLISVITPDEELKKLQQTRRQLSLEVTQVVNELGPTVFPELSVTKKQEDDEDEEELEHETRGRSNSVSSVYSTELSKVHSNTSLTDIGILGDSISRSDSPAPTTNAIKDDDKITNLVIQRRQ